MVDGAFLEMVDQDRQVKQEAEDLGISVDVAIAHVLVVICFVEGLVIRSWGHLVAIFDSRFQTVS